MIDIGVNLTNSRLLNKIDTVIENAINTGITALIVTGTSIEESQKAQQLCHQYGHHFSEGMYFTAGVHPHDAKLWDHQSRANILGLLQDSQAVAVGETGLDFNRNFSSSRDQQLAFRAQIEIAIEANMPIFMHERDAMTTQIEILQDYGNSLPPTLIHCFTGDEATLEQYLSLDCHIGVTGWVCDDKRGKELQNAVRNIPKNRLHIETDAPYLLPKNITPKPKSNTNQPLYLTWVATKIATLRGESLAELQTYSAQNSRMFFNLSFRN